MCLSNGTISVWVVDKENRKPHLVCHQPKILRYFLLRFHQRFMLACKQFSMPESYKAIQVVPDVRINYTTLLLQVSQP
ncbi:CLUMA_CG012298, isoform A [Clunio marinus]|uniref:CLUMA_CG012298, isoform A n=1 Tax=Clunio marinus TaxID=568069 RepID=A0A1J1IH88_9DIPT|nr:CLUMA_CG012298, isoform A [Clunio marinus]